MNTTLVNVFILLFGALQGFILIFLLLQKKAFRTGYVFLGAYLGVMIIQVLLKAMSKGWLMQHMEMVYFFSYQLPFLYGPLVWLCTKSLLQRRSFQKQDVLHLLPFLFFAIHTMVSLSAAGDVISLPPVSVHSRSWLQLASVVIYHALAMRAWHKYNAVAKQELPAIRLTRYRWIYQFIFTSFIVCCVVTVAIYLMYIYYPAWTNARYGFIALTVFIYRVSYQAWAQPELFSVYHGNTVGGSTPVPKLVVHYPAKKYVNSTLQPQEAVRIQEAVEGLLERKIYVDAALTIDKLAACAGCSRHHLSQVLNEKMGMSFYDCINSYRIREAKSLLLDPANSELKIAALAYDAGFNSLSTFNDAFKKATGVTPSRYKKDHESLPMKVQQG